MKLFDLFATIALDSKQAKAEISTMTKIVKKFSGDLGDIGGAFGSGLTNVMGSAFTAMKDGFVNAGKAGFMFANSLEQTETNFSVFLGSTEKAKALMGDIVDLAKKTPFELPELNKSAQALLNYGDTQAEVIPDLMRLGDIAMGNKEKLSGLTMAFGQVRGNGRLMGEELNQMIERGFNPLNDISKRTGKSIAVLRTEMSNGEISFEMVRQAMIDATSAGGSFYKSMEKSSKTLEGQWSTLKDNTVIVLGKIMTPLFNLLSNKVLPFFNNAFENSGNLVERKLTMLKLVFKDVFTSIKNIISQIMPEISNQFGGFSNTIVPTILASLMLFFDWIERNVPTIKFVLGEVITRIKDLVTNIVNLVINYMPLIAAVLGLAVVTFDTFNTVLGFIADNANILIPIMSSLLSAFVAFKIITTIATALTLLNTLMLAFRAGTLMATIAQIGLNLAFWVSPIGLIILGISALIGILVYLYNNVDGAKQAFVDFGKGVLSVMDTVRKGVMLSLKGLFLPFIASWNIMAYALSKISFTVPDWVPGIGGNKITGPKLPTIPLMANGGIIRRGGSAIVGEAGAELINLPKGASVTPLPKSGGITVNIIEPKIFKTSDIDDLMNVVVRRLSVANVGR